MSWDVCPRSLRLAAGGEEKGQVMLKVAGSRLLVAGVTPGRMAGNAAPLMVNRGKATSPTAVVMRMTLYGWVVPGVGARHAVSLPSATTIFAPSMRRHVSLGTHGGLPLPRAGGSLATSRQAQRPPSAPTSRSTPG